MALKEAKKLSDTETLIFLIHYYYNIEAALI